MIRLIASDLDGTLLKRDGTLPEEIFPLIRRLKTQNVIFCAASGRQYGNLRRLFAPVQDDIVYICENGSYVVSGNDAISQNIPNSMAVEIITNILDSGMQLMLSTPESSLLLASAQRSYTDDIFYRLRNTCTIIPDQSVSAYSYIKISGFTPDGVKDIAPPLIQKWSPFLHADIAGANWLDFTCANKGTGIDALSKCLNISTDEMAAFGDQYNDLSMLQKVGHPFLMANAPEELQKQCTFPLCENVMDTIKSLFDL